MTGVNLYGVLAIYRWEMTRTLRTLWQSVVAPVITTSLYFVVFGAAMGGQMKGVGGVGNYGSFLVPGLMMLSLLTLSIQNAALGIYFPKFTGTMFELLSAPVSSIEMVIGYVGAAASKSILIGLVILATSMLFVPLRVDHVPAMLAVLLLTAVTFSLFGFIIGIWADGFEQLNVVPVLVVTPLTFLGGAFYPLRILPEPWRTVSLFNPVAYLVSAFRWSFFSQGDISILACLAFIGAFLAACLGTVVWIFRSGYRLKS